MTEEPWKDWLVDNDDMYAPSLSSDDLLEWGGALGIIPATPEAKSISIFNLDAIDFQLPTLGASVYESRDEEACIGDNSVKLSNSDLQISVEHVLGDTGMTPSILLSPSDSIPREDLPRSSWPDAQYLAPLAGYHSSQTEGESEDESGSYSPLTTHHVPTPLSSPQAHTSQLLRARLSAAQVSPNSSGDSEDYANDSDDREDCAIESDSASEYDPEEDSAARSRFGAQRKRRTGTQRSPKKSRTRSFTSSDTPPLSPSPLSVASSIPSSPGSTTSPLRPGRIRSKQVTSTRVPFSRQCTICSYEPPRNCRAEMERHMNTHTYEERTRLHGHDWFCCGVPVNRAEEFGITDLSTARTWNNMNEMLGNTLMVGGCGAPFVRRDSYRRHLNGKRCVCVGDAKADWVPGNTSKRRASF